MPPKNVPYRDGYKMEPRFPKKGNLLKPLHGAGPRCRVDFSSDDAGPWVMVQIMRIDDDQTEHFRCAMPHYYAIPLILINKWLFFFEAQCAPDGTPLPLEGSGTPSLKHRDIMQYTYLWRLRCRFLQALFDMNHEKQLDEAWQCDKIHGFMHRTYKRYGHNTSQRRAYWKCETEAGRMPYATPSIADMDWKAFLDEEMRACTRLNAFLWNRISQGYSRVVQVDPPCASWQEWRRGGTSRSLSASPHRTPPPPSTAAAPFPMPTRRRRSSSSSRSNRSTISLSDGPDGSSAAEQEGEEGVVGTAAAAARGKGKAAADDNDPRRRRCSAATFVAVGDNNNNNNNNMDCGAVLAAIFDDGSQERALTLPMSDLSRGASQAAASTSGTGDPSLGRTRMLFALDVPKGMAVTDVLWTVSREEDVSSGHKTSLRVNYGSDPC